MLKRNVFSIKFLILVLGLITYVGVMQNFDAGALIAAEIDNRKTDRLYQDMGVLKIPRIAPPVDFKLLNLNGGTVRLSDYSGKILFLNFWATWCPACRIEMPSMEKLYAKLKDKDFAMAAVDLQESASRVKAFVKDYQLTFTVLLDRTGEIGRRFGIRSIPTTFILDRDGAIIGRVPGPREWDSKKSIALFEHLMNKEADR